MSANRPRREPGHEARAGTHGHGIPVVEAQARVAAAQRFLAHGLNPAGPVVYDLIECAQQALALLSKAEEWLEVAA